MSRLTSKSRKKIPTSKFAGPNRTYPVENRNHAEDAKARAAEVYHEGRMSKAEEQQIDRRADAVLHRGGKK